MRTPVGLVADPAPPGGRQTCGALAVREPRIGRQATRQPACDDGPRQRANGCPAIGRLDHHLCIRASPVVPVIGAVPLGKLVFEGDPLRRLPAVLDDGVDGLEIDQRRDSQPCQLARDRHAQPATPRFRVPLPDLGQPDACGFTQGALFIAAGILQSLESRDELAALIAHEYAHVVLEHSGRSSARDAVRAVQGVGAVYLALRHGSAGDSALGSAVVRDVVMHAALVEGLQGGMLPERTRRHETDADLLATDLLVRSGHNPAAMVDFLDKLDTWETARQAAAKAQEARLVDIGSAMKTHAASGDIGGALSAAITGGIGNVFSAGSSIVSRGLGKMRREHVSPAQRIEHVRERIEREHADAERPEMRPLPWAGDAEIARLMAGLDATHRFVGALQAEDTASYPAHVRTVRASSAASTPYARYALLQVYSARDSRKTAVRDMRAELDRPDSLFASHLLALEVLEEVGSPKDQVAALESSRASLGDPPELLPYAVRIHRRAGDTHAANQALARCLGQGDPALANACG